MSVSEIFQFVIMICAIAKLFYEIGRDIRDNKREEKNTKK